LSPCKKDVENSNFYEFLNSNSKTLDLGQNPLAFLNNVKEGVVEIVPPLENVNVLIVRGQECNG
jgi:hypothetical protein